MCVEREKDRQTDRKNMKMRALDEFGFDSRQYFSLVVHGTVCIPDKFFWPFET